MREGRDVSHGFTTCAGIRSSREATVGADSAEPEAKGVEEPVIPVRPARSVSIYLRLSPSASHVVFGRSLYTSLARAVYMLTAAENTGSK